VLAILDQKSCFGCIAVKFLNSFYVDSSESTQ